MTDWLTDSPTWIQEMLAHLKITPISNQACFGEHFPFHHLGLPSSPLTDVAELFIDALASASWLDMGIDGISARYQMLKYFNTTYAHHMTSNTWTTGCKWHVNIGKFPGRLCSCGNPLPTDCLHNVLVRAPSPCNRQQRNLLTSNTHHEKSVPPGNKYYLANNDKVKVSKIGSEGWNACYFTLRPAFPLSDKSISVLWESEFTRVYFAQTAGSLFLPV